MCAVYLVVCLCVHSLVCHVSVCLGVHARCFVPPADSANGRMSFLVLECDVDVFHGVQYKIAVPKIVTTQAIVADDELVLLVNVNMFSYFST